MNLIVDSGNTMVKLAVFENGVIIFDISVGLKSVTQNIKGIFEKHPKITHAIVSNVGHLNQKDIAVLSIFCKVHVLGNRA